MVGSYPATSQKNWMSTQDASGAVHFISPLKALPHFKGQAKLSTWLYLIVVNVCLMRIRKDKSRAKYVSENLFDDALVYGWGNDPEKAAVNSELRSTLESGLDIRSPDLCAAVVLRDIQGLSTEKAAKALNVSIASLKSRLYRAKILLRKHLDRYYSLALLPLRPRLLTPVKPWSDSLVFSGLICLPFSSPIY